MSDSLQNSFSGSSLSSLSGSASSNDLSAMQQVMKGAPVLTKSYSTKQVDIMSQAKDHPGRKNTRIQLLQKTEQKKKQNYINVKVQILSNH